MTPERRKKVEEILAAALERAPGERSSFVARECDGDDSLRHEVETLIISYDEAVSFAAGPSGDGAAGGDDSLSPLIGRRLGAYRIVREIGRGGMGAVYLAVRADDEFRRRVAIKVVKRGMDTDFILRRFRQERQILASLDHPHIARLLDGGTTDDGLPYFVMEYIQGTPVTRYCDAQKLSTSERVRLFVKVCSAVHYAHQNLVIHRDLKPSNVIVTADGTPKLLDFGIAKLLNPEMNAQTLDPTTLAMRLMTPEYASPEQVRGQPVNAASDVYSLGVLLYELLTGHRPYRLHNRLPEELAHVICEEEPERPSLAINLIEVIAPHSSEPIEITPETVSRVRASTLDKLRRQLAGSLDNVVLKALRKEPQRRYQTVAELAEDLERYLEGQPVSAPPHFAAPRAQGGAAGADAGDAPTGVSSVAVLPFKTLHAEGREDEYLGMGLADALITRLSNVRRIVVRPTSAVIKYFDGEHSAHAAGHELDVDFVLDGRVQRAPDRVRLTVQLVRVRDGAPLWAATFDEKFTDIFTVEDSLAVQVAGALTPQLVGDERDPTQQPGHEGDGDSQAYRRAPRTRETGAHTGEAQDAQAVTRDARLTARSRARWRGLAVGLAALVLVAAGGFGLYRFFNRGPATAPFQSAKAVRLTAGGNAVGAAISPDGKYVAYAVNEAGRQSLWVRQVAVTNGVRLVAPAEVEYRGLTFSHDATYVYYVAAERGGAAALYQVPALGGSVKMLKGGVDSPVGLSPDGRHLAYVRTDAERGEDALLVADADGTGERQLALRKFPEHFSASSAPAWSPDGRTVACVAEGVDAGGFYMKATGVRVEGGAEESLTPQRWVKLGQMAWLPGGDALVMTARDGESSFEQLWSLSYPAGEARKITGDLSDYRGVGLPSGAGALITVQQQTLTNVWVAPAADIGRLTQITSGAGRYVDPAWTPEGKILYASDASGVADVWEMEANGTDQRQLTAGAGRNYGPAPSPDGRLVVFHSNRSGAWQVWRMERDGSNPLQLSRGGEESTFAQVSPDGRAVVYQHVGMGTLATLWKVSIDGGTPERLTDELSVRASVSPDGRAVACWHKQQKPNAPWRIAVTSLEVGPEAPRLFDVPQSPTNAQTVLRWTPDGRAVLYLDYRGGATALWRQPLDGTPPQKLHDFPNEQVYAFDLSRDGRFVFSRGLLTSDVVLLTEAK